MNEPMRIDLRRRLLMDFEVPGLAQAKQRPRFAGVRANGAPVVKTSAKTKAWEQLVGYMARAKYHAEPTAQRVHLEVHVRMHWPRGSGYAKNEPDLDNVVKAVQDGLNGVVLIDDRQVVGLTATKGYSQAERTYVAVWSIDDASGTFEP